MIRRLLSEVVEGVTGLPMERPGGADIGDAARGRPPRRPRPTPEDEEAAAASPRRTRHEPARAEPTPEAASANLGLGSRAELRRAFLLLEILGPPAALRDPRTPR